MRYYKIDITDDGGAPVMFSSLNGLALTSLLPNGQPNMAALNVELDIPYAPQHSPDAQSYIRIWGLGLKDLGSAQDLNDKNISIYAGMSKGLPLANPAQARLLVKGKIFQAFGNWVGTDMTVDLILQPATGTQAAPANFVLNWQAGTSLATALSSTLQTALPLATLNINVSNRLILNHDEIAYYETLQQLATFVYGASKTIIKDQGYPGVNIAYDGTRLTVTDLYGPPTPAIQIQPQDLIGQPTWIGPQLIQAKFVLRGDLDLLSIVTLPPTLVTTGAQAFSRFRDKTAFTGNYVIQRIHHYGNFRQPDAASWNTTVDMFPEPRNGQ